MSVSIYILCLFVYPKNVKTAEPIGSKFLVVTSHVPREGLYMTKISKFCLQQIRLEKFVCFCFTMYTKRKCSQDGCEAS